MESSSKPHSLAMVSVMVTMRIRITNAKYSTCVNRSRCQTVPSLTIIGVLYAVTKLFSTKSLYHAPIQRMQFHARMQGEYINMKKNWNCDPNRNSIKLINNFQGFLPRERLFWRSTSTVSESKWLRSISGACITCLWLEDFKHQRLNVQKRDNKCRASD